MPGFRGRDTGHKALSGVITLPRTHPKWPEGESESESESEGEGEGAPTYTQATVMQELQDLKRPAKKPRRVSLADRGFVLVNKQKAPVQPSGGPSQ